jgi:DUF971 family protein
MPPQPIPTNLDVRKTEGLTITWSDGLTAKLANATLRSLCPCAKCKEEREQPAKPKPLLRVLPGNYAGELAIKSAELVGNYALRIAWTDSHDTGIYSFVFLRELSEKAR